jgi:flagellar assembly protein FliH
VHSSILSDRKAGNNVFIQENPGVMSSSPLSPQDVSLLIDHLLKQQDPGAVGLRRIIKKKQGQGESFPVTEISYPEFPVPGKKAFTDEEQQILELEKTVLELQQSLKDTTQRAQRAIQAAYKQGREEGLAAGKASGMSEAEQKYRDQLSQLQQRLASFLNEISNSKKQMFSSSTHIVLRLALDLAKKITLTEISANRELILAVVKKSLTYIADRENIRIRVAKDDLETVSGNKDFWIPISERLANVSIEQDERIEKGGCIIESNSGMVDARLGVQLKELDELIEKTWQAMQSSAHRPDSAAVAPAAEEDTKK